MEQQNVQQNQNEDQCEVGMVRDTTHKHPSELQPVPQAAYNPVNGRFAAVASYWLNGLHNREGLKLAEEINGLIKLKKLEENEAAIKAILKTFPTARQFGIDVFAEEYYLNDPHRKANLAEPITLLNGALTRDKEGAYRPSAGGKPVLLDKGDSVTVKNLQDGPSAAVALMMAKGCKAIRVSGSKKTQEAMWLAAAFAGLEVVDYEPSKVAQGKLADMFAKKSVGKAAEKTNDIEIINKSQPCVTDGVYEGKITRVADGVAKQKTGRDPDVFVKHDISKLSRVPQEDEVIGIHYKDGRGQVSERAVGVEKAGQVR